MDTLHSPEQRAILTELAQQTIRRSLSDRVRRPPSIDALPSWTQVRRATFVTVTLDGDLNGCIGTLAPRRPLADDIASNAFGAAFEDPRFPPLSEAHAERFAVHICILGPLAGVAATSDEELLAQMTTGEFGWVLDDGRRRGTFLPAVWEKLPEPADFLAYLKRKAGMAPREWPPGLAVSRFEVEEF